jgi:hypothetical protein
MSVVSMSEYERLPLCLLRRASEWPDGEPGWRREDVPAVIEAARMAGMVNLGGQPQFRLRGPIELHWLNYDPSPRHQGEAWASYVERSANETLTAFERMLRETDFVREAFAWSLTRAAAEAGVDPLEHLWFLLYFEEHET